VYILLSNIPSMSYTRELDRDRSNLSIPDSALVARDLGACNQSAMYQLISHLVWRSGLAVFFHTR
jgi:hypothetical protein